MNYIFKRFLSLLLAALMLLAVGQGLTLPRAEAAANDWEIGRAEWFLRICGDEETDVNDVRIRRLLDMLEYRGQNQLRKMDTTTTAQRLFHSSATDNVPIVSSANMTGEYQALWQIALAYGTYGSKYYRDPDVEAKLLYGVKWLNEHYYGDKQTYGKGADGWHSMTGYNWWDWYVGVPQYLYDILIILDHFGLLTDAMVDKYLAPVKYIMEDPDNIYRYPVDNDEPYDHKIKHIVIMLGYSLLQEDSGLMKHLVDDVAFCMQPSETGNGIREDNSFRFHEYYAMEGTYGADILVNRIIQTTGILHDTSFLDSIGKEALAAQVDWFTDIFAPVMHNGVVMAQSNGRYPHSGISYGNNVLQGALALVGLYPEKEAKLRQFIREQMGENSLSSYDKLYFQRVLNEVQDEAEAEEGEEYARTRYITDRVVQHRKEYTAGLALSSNRTLRYECINDCNMKGWYTGDGMLYVYTDKTSPKYDEYGSNYFSNVNMHRLPGTTEDTAERTPVSVSSTYRKHMIPNESFVGGVQFDDDYATIAYDFAAYNSTGNENATHTGYGGGNPAVTSDLKAKKSYFFFDNEIVCLGAAITSTNPTAIHTYVDNRQLSQSAVENGTVIYGTEDITVDGTLMEKSAAYTKTFTNPKSVYVEDFGGYYFPDGGNVTLNKTDGAISFYELWLDHGVKPTNAKYSYVMLPTMDAAEVAAYAKQPEIEIVNNNEKHQVVRDVSSGAIGMVFWKASTYCGITVDQPLTIMLREQDGTLKISVADPTQELTTATVTIDQRLYKLACDGEIAVTEGELNTKMVIDFATAGGKSVTAEFGQKSTRELLFSFTGMNSELQSYATATYGGSNFCKANSWQGNGASSRPTIDTANGGSLVMDLVQDKTYHWVQVTEYGHNVYSNPLQYVPHADDVVQVRFKLENCTVTDTSQLWFQYTGPEETTDSITSGQIVKQSLPKDYAVGEYVVMTFRNLPQKYSGLSLLSSFRLYFYNVTAGADAKLTFDTIYIGKEANAPANAPLYFDFGGSDTELYRYTDVSYGSGAYNFADKTYWAKHSERTTALSVENGILSFTVSTDESKGATTWLRPSNGKGSNTALLLSQNRANAEVVQLRLRITGTLRDNSDITIYSSKEAGKFSTLAKANRSLLKTGEFYILDLPISGTPKDEWYGLFTLDTHNMQGCTVEIDYIYIGNRANAPQTQGLLMEFENSMSDVYRYNLPQYLSYNFDDSTHWAANYERSSKPVVNGQSGCLEYELHHSQTWLRPSTGRNNSTNQSLAYTPSTDDVFQIHFRADGFTGKSGALYLSFTDGTKQSNGWFVFQKLAASQTIYPKDGEYITLTLPLTEEAKASVLQTITIDFGNMAGSKIYIDSIYIGPAEGAPCCTDKHTAAGDNGKTATCTEAGYSGDYYCTACGHQTAKGQPMEQLAHKNSYTVLDYSHKAKCTICGDMQWEAHEYDSKGLCECGAKKENEPKDYIYIGFENDGEAQARYSTLSYCGYNYDTSVCWGYNSSRCTTPMVSEAEGCLTLKVIDTTSWVRPALTNRLVGYTNMYFSTECIEVFQIRLKLERETASSTENINLGYTSGTYDSSNGNPVYRNIKNISAKVLNTVPDGEFVTLTIALDDYNWPWEIIRGINLNFNGMKGTTVTIDYIYLGSYDNVSTCKEGHSYDYKATKNPTTSAAGTLTGTCSKCSGTTTVTLPKLNTTDYTKTTTKAATCTATGTDSYKWKTTTYGTFTFSATTKALGHSYTTKVTEPTCTAKGYTTHTCSRCSDSYKDTYTDATGHNYTSKVTTAATCTKDGVKTYTCSKCSDTYTEAIAATGHKAVTDKAVAATCTIDGKTEGSHCSVCNAVLVAQEVLPALGHNYSYTSNGDGTHNGDCTRCDSMITEKHTFEGETCFCGAKILTVDESIQIYHTLDLASDISISFVVQKSALTNYDSYCMEFVLPEYKGNELMGTSTVTVEPVDKGSYYYFTLTGITAVRMGDMVDATLHMTKGTQEYISQTDTYSVATYAYATLEKSTDAKMLTLCADLLRYGAEAQSYKKYRTNALVDAAMTDVHRRYLSNTESLTFTATDSFLGDLASPTITWVGKTLDLGSKVGLKFVFNTKNYGGNVENLSMKVSYQGSNGETKTVTLTGAEAYGSTGSYYSFTFYGLLASELRTIVDVAIFDGETQLSETIRYSAESYASKAATGDLAPLCKALFAYSDSAKAYFAK